PPSLVPPLAPPPPHTPPLSLHDALPILHRRPRHRALDQPGLPPGGPVHHRRVRGTSRPHGRSGPRSDHHHRQHGPDELQPAAGRSEEHTSELQSPDHLVCRLLLEKKKNK